MDSTISDEEAYQNTYYHFIRVVKILSEPAEKQCELVGNFNVAWELKDDLSDGLYLIKSPASSLSAIQKEAIQKLLNELNKIPSIILSEATNHEINLKAMQHPVWASLREQAVKLLLTLESATKSNEEYFN